MGRLADVVVMAPIRPVLTYEVPPALETQVTIGSLVTVPLGSRTLYGVVIAHPEAHSPHIELRPLASLVEREPVVTDTQIALAHWMSREYVAPLWRCLALMLPPGLVGAADLLVSLTAHARRENAGTVSQEELFIVLDRRGPLRGRQLDRLLPRQRWRRAASQMARRGLVVKTPVLLPPRARPRRVWTVRLLPDADADGGVESKLAGLRSLVYPAIVAFLRAEGGPVDVSWVYAETGCSRYHLNKLAERGVVGFDTEEAWRDPLADELFVPDTPPPLTSDQQAVWNVIQTAMQARQSEVFLLHGVTGSGKTEIYLRAVDEMLRQGRQAIVLLPEIGLTPQMAHRFGARFGRRIAIWHSMLTTGELYDTWRRVRAGDVDVVLGPRSALFVPMARLGLIVVDEEDSPGYKQGEVPFESAGRPRDRLPPEPRVPLYHARDAALTLARLAGATVLLGSATPSLESYYRAQRGEFTLLEMPRRVMAHRGRLADLQARYGVARTVYRSLPSKVSGSGEGRYLPLPPVQIVDLRAELRAGNRSIFSRALQQALERAFERGEQAILFVNRRGTATFVLCRDCGYVARCPHCGTPLTYHGPKAALICHHCAYQEPQPTRCPQCDGQRIRYFGLGTERVEQVVHERWPQVRTLRWDRDTTRHYAAHAAILDLFTSGLAHVLVGTQMVARGLDLPLVTVVGVVAADTTLDLPDFRAAERTFQLLTQVAGRAGRGLLGGRTIIQTYHPDHYAVVAAAEHNYTRFARRELAFRREQGYPPYVRLTRLYYEDADFSRGRATAAAFGDTLRAALAREDTIGGDLIGPVQPFIPRRHGRHRWQLLLRHPDPAALLATVDIPQGWRVDVDAVDIL